ncbi:MAG TPA: alanine--tRNA ligase [Candidatus Paceibacterota bacterium]|nr:alanine--tRNA ligase [Candidatus Paceibacterota bacterium]
MTSAEVRKRFLAFFEKRGHAIIPSASLVPENDPTVLFNTAGMQPLVPYLMGRAHPQGDRLADFQKCVRTGDIDDIGDNTHLTFFEMMGNWSLGSYFKEEAIAWSYELLTSKTEGFGLDPKRLYVTVFAGDENAPRDDEAARIWESVGMPKHRIYFKGASANWWPAVKSKEPGKDTWTGPTGPCSEMFYDLTPEGLGDLTPEQYDAADEAQKVVEIWNDVFMEYEKKDGKIVGRLAKKNVDTGSGFERVCTVLQKKSNVFETDIFAPIMAIAKTLAGDIRRQRIISDHIRTATFMIADGVVPANTDQGYVLRRIIRRMVFNTDAKKLDRSSVETLIGILVEQFSAFYPNIESGEATIIDEISKEADKFAKTLDQGVKEFEKLAKTGKVTATDAFTLFSSYGFPIDMTIELARGKDLVVDRGAYEIEFKKHQDLSRAGAEQKFKGGLGDTSDMSLRYHTATHLLHKALHEVLGDHVMQKGSNITPERLRFDFTHTAKMTDDEKKRVEDIVNAKIKAALPVNKVELPKEEALKTGAYHFFGDKYGDVVSVYYIGDDLAGAYSKEFCGGPHVMNTKELGTFKIQKEEAVSAGVRRIKAVLS